MALFYLVRHGSNDYLAKGLAGRLPGVHLNEQGRAEANRLAHSLASASIRKIISSPLERARETAEPLASKLGLPIEFSDDVLEVDFGRWNGALLQDLQSDPLWARYNSYRSGTCIPEGELILQIQNRFVTKLEQLRASNPEGITAIFSHGDPIRSALCYYLGIPLDFLQRFEVSPGSFSVLLLEPWGPKVLSINSIPQ
jgi:broad specificity phosphatase PhoE